VYLNTLQLFFMAKTTYNIDIDGAIGEYYYSKGYVKYMLGQTKDPLVKVRMSSLGGSLDHGLGIKDRFQEHGNVKVDMYGFNASAATLAALGAKTTEISSSGFYLIHKVMNWIDVYGSKNADELAAIIADLEANKKDNEKMDIVIAQLYAEKTGKPINDLIDLMKVGGWLTAQEALEWGFVDGIIKTNEKTNFVNMQDKFNAMGLPTNRIVTEHLFNHSNKNNPMKKQPIKINAVLGVPSLESTEEDGVFLNETQIEAIEAKLSDFDGKVNTLTTEKTNAETRATDAEAKEATANATIVTKDTEIANLKTQVENLKGGAGDKTKELDKETDDKGGEKEDPFLNSVKNARKLFNELPD